VLELKELKPESAAAFLQQHTDRELEDNADRFENDQLRKLVNDELHRYGLLLKRNVVPHKQGWRTKEREYILYGQLIGPPGWKSRPEVCMGSFKDCCIKAAQVLDELDKSQLPDTATGNA
jgi:hypothetical protein